MEVQPRTTHSILGDLMLLLISIVLLSFILLFSSFYIDKSGGLYTQSYLKQGELISFSEIQSSGSNDSIIIFIVSFLMSVLFLITSLIPIKLNIKYYLFLIYLMASFYALNLVEISSFLEISYSTIFLGKNISYIVWFTVYLTIFFTVTYKVYISLKETNNTPRQ